MALINYCFQNSHFDDILDFPGNRECCYCFRRCRLEVWISALAENVITFHYRGGDDFLIIDLYVGNKVE